MLINADSEVRRPALGLILISVVPAQLVLSAANTSSLFPKQNFRNSIA